MHRAVPVFANAFEPTPLQVPMRADSDIPLTISRTPASVDLARSSLYAPAIEIGDVVQWLPMPISDGTSAPGSGDFKPNCWAMPASTSGLTAAANARK